jgi:trans-aconitate methyltransferase
MKRRPEPELMTEAEQVAAYGNADFEEPHSHFVNLLLESMPRGKEVVRALDLGCGAGDITFRLAGAFPDAVVDAVDGSAEMLKFAAGLLERKPGLSGRVRFIRSMIGDFEPGGEYGLIVSNSLLHHLPDPAVLWDAVKRLSSPRTFLFVMDLHRPESERQAKRLTELYASTEPEILRRDFYNSLLAAFDVEEVRAQLASSGLSHLKTEMVSDRHFIVYGSSLADQSPA